MFCVGVYIYIYIYMYIYIYIFPKQWLHLGVPTCAQRY